MGRNWSNFAHTLTDTHTTAAKLVVRITIYNLPFKFPSGYSWFHIEVRPKAVFIKLFSALAYISSALPSHSFYNPLHSDSLTHVILFINAFVTLS